MVSRCHRLLYRASTATSRGRSRAVVPPYARFEPLPSTAFKVNRCRIFENIANTLGPRESISTAWIFDLIMSIPYIRNGDREFNALRMSDLDLQDYGQDWLIAVHCATMLPSAALLNSISTNMRRSVLSAIPNSYERQTFGRVRARIRRGIYCPRLYCPALISSGQQGASNCLFGGSTNIETFRNPG